MKEKKKNTRINIMISEDLLERVDKKASEMSLNRSGYICYILAEKLDNEKNLYQQLRNFMDELSVKTMDERSE